MLAHSPLTRRRERGTVAFPRSSSEPATSHRLWTKREEKTPNTQAEPRRGGEEGVGGQAEQRPMRLIRKLVKKLTQEIWINAPALSIDSHDEWSDY